jgi:hypothetical protein
MKTSKLILLLVASIGLTFHSSLAATIPSGTMLLLKTSNSISSRDNAGKRFYGTLIQGAGSLPAGTKVTGVIVSPYVAIGSTTRPMTLRLTELSVKGRTVLISTQVFDAQATGVYGRRGTRLTGNNFVFPPGTMMQFVLNRPVSI